MHVQMFARYVILELLHRHGDVIVYCITVVILCHHGDVMHISLSTIVLNSRDWSEILWLPEISRFKINLAIGFIRKNPLECIG